MPFRCTSCDHELPEHDLPAAPGTPCPRCGAELVPEQPLALDPAWEAERARKVAAGELPPRRPSKKIGGLILALTMVVMVVVAVVMVMQRQPSAKGVEDIADRIEITITAPRPVPVTIDGARAGTTPVVIKLKGSSTRTMKIAGNGVTIEIAPDRDQVVNLVKPR